MAPVPLLAAILLASLVYRFLVLEQRPADHGFDPGAAMAEQDFAEDRRIFVIGKLQKRVRAPAHYALPVRSVDRPGGKIQLGLVQQAFDECVATVPELRPLLRLRLCNCHAPRHPFRLRAT